MPPQTETNDQEMPGPSDKRKEITNPTSDAHAESDTDPTDWDSTDSESDEDENFDQPNEPYELNPNSKIKFYNMRQNLLARYDNLIIVTTQSGDPCEKESRLMKKANLLPPIRDAALARARVILYKKKNLIALIIKDRISPIIEKEIIEEAIISRRDKRARNTHILHMQ